MNYIKARELLRNMLSTPDNWVTPAWKENIKKVLDEEDETHHLRAKVLELESDLRVVTSLYADAVKRNIKFTEKLENRAVNLTQNQREILHKAILKAVDLY